ncbi:uncharacterized protein LOC135849976 [Planococcus citri]|uniref:uncharacterized protein LOC135849976 n=1 Tax=Planococcus citri TaxID=170843 RepID=UPI0031F77D29
MPNRNKKKQDGLYKELFRRKFACSNNSFNIGDNPRRVPLEKVAALIAAAGRLTRIRVSRVIDISIIITPLLINVPREVQPENSYYIRDYEQEFERPDQIRQNNPPSGSISDSSVGDEIPSKVLRTDPSTRQVKADFTSATSSSSCALSSQNVRCQPNILPERPPIQQADTTWLTGNQLTDFVNNFESFITFMFLNPPEGLSISFAVFREIGYEIYDELNERLQ